MRNIAIESKIRTIYMLLKEDIHILAHEGDTDQRRFFGNMLENICGLEMLTFKYIEDATKDGIPPLPSIEKGYGPN